MKLKSTIMVLSLFIFSVFATPAVAGHDTPVNAAITEYIFARTDAGVYYVGDVATRFDFIHSDVTKKNGLYVSCADFNRGSIIYDIDFYLFKEGDTYRVVKEVLHKVDGKTVNRVLRLNK